MPQRGPQPTGASSAVTYADTVPYMSVNYTDSTWYHEEDDLPLETGSRRQEDKSVCFEALSCLCCVVGTALCVRDSSRGSRLVVTWLWLILMSLTTGLTFSIFIYGPYRSQVSPADEKIIHKGFSTLFCSRLDIFSPQKFSSYHLRQLPEISPHEEVYNTSKEEVHLSNNKHQVWKFYLLESSYITVSVSSGQFFELYFIQGEKNVEKWEKGQCKNACFIEKHIVYPSNHGEEKYKNIKLERVPRNGNYFIGVVAQKFQWTAELHIFFKMHRRKYHIKPEDVISMCEHDIRCKFSISVFSSELVMYNISEDAPLKNHLKIKCDSRDPAYYIIFCVFPLVLGWVISVIILFRCKSPDETVQESVAASPRAMRSGRRRRRFVSVPPSYETLVEEGDLPPAYQSIDEGDQSETSQSCPPALNYV